MSSSSSTVLNRAANVPGWVVVALSLVILAITAVVALQRQATAQPTPSATSSLSAAASLPPVRRDVVSRSADGSRTATADQTVRRTVPLVRKSDPVLPVSSSDATQTVQSAEASTYNIPGLCLNWSREQADIPSRYDSAATAWVHAAGRHSGDTNPPKGAAVYWTGGSRGYGHIAISVGHGRVRSSDAGGPGVVATVPLRWITREWSLTYVGWADSINGYTIPGVAGA